MVTLLGIGLGTKQATVRYSHLVGYQQSGICCMSYGREQSGATAVSTVTVYGLRELLGARWTSSNSHVPTLIGWRSC